MLTVQRDPDPRTLNLAEVNHLIRDAYRVHENFRSANGETMAGSKNADRSQSLRILPDDGCSVLIGATPYDRKAIDLLVEGLEVLRGANFDQLLFIVERPIHILPAEQEVGLVQELAWRIGTNQGIKLLYAESSETDPKVVADAVNRGRIHGVDPGEIFGTVACNVADRAPRRMKIDVPRIIETLQQTWRESDRAELYRSALKLLSLDRERIYQVHAALHHGLELAQAAPRHLKYWNLVQDLIASAVATSSCAADEILGYIIISNAPRRQTALNEPAALLACYEAWKSLLTFNQLHDACVMMRDYRHTAIEGRDKDAGHRMRLIDEVIRASRMDNLLVTLRSAFGRYKQRTQRLIISDRTIMPAVAEALGALGAGPPAE